jgi:hypothetical protein
MLEKKVMVNGSAPIQAIAIPWKHYPMAFKKKSHMNEALVEHARLNIGIHMDTNTNKELK